MPSIPREGLGEDSNVRDINLSSCAHTLLRRTVEVVEVAVLHVTIQRYYMYGEEGI
jgi:hypothetical protein